MWLGLEKESTKRKNKGKENKLINKETEEEDVVHWRRKTEKQTRKKKREGNFLASIEGSRHSEPNFP